jgi:hypothetical protein
MRVFQASRISKCFMLTAAGEMEHDDAEKSFEQPVIRLTCDAAVRMRESDVDQPSYREFVLSRESGWGDTERTTCPS